MNESDLTDLLSRFKLGQIEIGAVLAQLTFPQWGPTRLETGATPPTGQTPAARVDLDRLRRCGHPEVVYSPGKTAAAIVDVFRVQLSSGQSCLATRVSAEQAGEVMASFPAAKHNATARTIRVSPDVTGSQAARKPASGRSGRVAVITAGTADLPVGEEAVETARWMGCQVDLIIDVGVAGPQRLTEQKHRFEGADAIVVVAGMEGALPSVVGGHVACPVVAVPTSAGYGASFGGVAALLGMLNSCAANVTVVNIDAGFKAGYVAGLIAERAVGRRREPEAG